MAKKDKDIDKIIESAGKRISPIQTDDESVTTKSPKELRQERRDAIREQRDVINYTKDLRKKDEYFAGDSYINTAKQNIKTIKDNAKEELKVYNTKVKNDRIARQQGYADEAVGLVADWMERTGQDNIDEQSLATVLSPKQLWYFQKFNNKGSNWGNTLGGREFFGELNNNTVSSINQKAKERLGAKQQQEKEARSDDDPLKTSTGAEMKIGNVAISNKKINEMKDWGDGITDVNAISPEKVQQLYEKLESYGVAVPKEQVLDEQGNAVVDENNSPVMQYAIGNDSYTIDTILDELDDAGDGDMVLEALGFRDSQTNRLAVPHHRTYEEILADRQRAQDELRYANEQKALQRQQARLGLADLAAGIGDMIKASGGAIVTPRDYRAMYDSLTEQQKTNYNNYLARMDALKAEQKAKQKEAADRAYQERLLAEQRAYQEEQARKAQEFQASESKKNREHQESMLSDRLEAQKEIQRLKNQNAIDRLHLNIESKEASNSAKYGTSIPFDGEIIPIKPNLSDGLYQGIYGYIEPAIRNHPAFVNELASIDKAYLETNPKAVRVIVANALTNPTVNITAEMKAAIRKLINDAKVQQEEGDAGSQGITIPKEANLVEQVVNASPEEIVTSWWNP